MAASVEGIDSKELRIKALEIVIKRRELQLKQLRDELQAIKKQ